MSWCDPTRPRKKPNTLLRRVKTGGGGIRVWRFMSSFSHMDNGLKTWEKKTVGLDVFWRDGADLTDASGFNGVEQCEKGLSRRNSKVHHATFIQIALCFFSPPITVFPYFSLFSSPYPEMNRGLVITSTSSGIILTSVQISAGYSFLSLFIKLSKTPYVKAKSAS